jgi:hypothetical protein
MPPKRRQAKPKSPPKAKRTREETATARLDKKSDVSSDNLRNRLIRRFGAEYVKKVNGELPSEILQQEQMVVTCFERLRGLKDGHGVKDRTRVVTIGLSTVVTRPDIVDGLRRLSDFVSKVRVAASLFANYVNMKMLEQGERPPEPVPDFFKQCLNLFRGSGKASELLQGHFAVFTRQTGLAAYSWSGGSVDQAFVYQSQDMATAASTYVEVHYKKRLVTIVKWALRMRISRPPAVTKKAFGARLHSLAVWVTGVREEPDVIAALRTRMDELGLLQSFDSVEPLCCEILDWELVLGRRATVEDCRLHLLRLQLLYVHDDARRYQSICSALHQAHPGKQNVKVRGALIKEQWGHPTPPKETCPLPVCHTGATFVRVDKKMLKAMFPDLQGRAEGVWGWRAFMDPFSKRANIPCLRRRRNWYARSERGMMQAIADVEDVTECPWLVGPTFETDGKQMKLLLLSSEHSNPSIPGLPELNKAGYMAVSKGPVSLKAVLERGNGVYRLEHVVPDESLDTTNTEVSAVDPGQVHPFHCMRATGDVWAHARTEIVVGSQRVEEVYITEKQYGEWTGRKVWQEHEEARRHPTGAYGQALDALLGTRRRTLDSSEFVQHCRIFADHQHVIWKELLAMQRRTRRFARFGRVASAIERAAEMIAKMRDKGKCRRVVFFGAATFRSQKGRAAAPLKKLVRAVAQRVATVMTPEGGTSKYCPICGAELLVVHDGEDNRTRHCPNERCPLHHTPFNRDKGGATGIGGRGCDHVAGAVVQGGLNEDDFDIISDDDDTDVDGLVLE